MPDAQPTDREVSLRAVVDALPRAIIVMDGEGRIVLWNERASELYGWTEEEVLGKVAADVLLPFDPSGSNRDVFDRVLAGERFVGDRTVRNRSGDLLRIFAITDPILDASGQIDWVVGASEDVTDLRVAEQRNQDLSEHLRLALDAAGLGTWRWDLTTGEVVWDPRMEALFGFAPGEFGGTFDAYQAALHPDDRDAVRTTLDRALQEQSHYRVEHRVVTNDGSIRWIHGAGKVTVGPDGTVTGAIGCSMDVTDRVEARLASEAAANAAREAAERERIDRERFEFLLAVNEAVAEAGSRDEIMAAVTRASVPRLGDWCSIFVLPDDGGRVPDTETFHVDPAMVEYARQLSERFTFDPDALTGAAAVIRTGTPEFFPEITPQVVDEVLAGSPYDEDQSVELRAVVERLALHSAITVPLVKRGRVLGALSFVNTSGRRTFTADDLALAQVVASRVASSIENRRLTDQQRRIAATLQASLLPDKLPNIPRLDVAVRYWAAGEGTEVGGDFYDIFALGEDSWAVVIGDVCGKGAAAAALTSLARHTIRQAAWRGDEAVELLQWLNRAMIASAGQSESFLTVSFASLRKSADGFDLEVTNAGHAPAVLVRSSGVATPVGEHGRLVGVFDTVTASTVHERLRPGDTLVLYTDGLTDVPPPNALDTEQTVAFVAACADGVGTADDIASRLEAAVQERLLVQDRSDDIALVVLRVL